MATTTLKARITGRVQGVNFRAWAQGEAEARGISGWVQNEPDGSVSALIHGEDDAVNAMVGALKAGPPAARVDHVDLAAAAPPAEAGFRITG